MLRVARRFGRPRRSVDYRVGTAEALPLEDGSATAAWTLSSVPHWQDVEAGDAEVVRVLAPAGRLVAIERLTAPGASGLASHGWTEAQAEAFAELCRAAGCVDVRVETAARSGKRRRHHGRDDSIAVLATKPR
jgi:ubiquinone/menaquinone biosynthesis C-methylase UbiE